MASKVTYKFNPDAKIMKIGCLAHQDLSLFCNIVQKIPARISGRGILIAACLFVALSTLSQSLVSLKRQEPDLMKF